MFLALDPPSCIHSIFIRKERKVPLISLKPSSARVSGVGPQITRSHWVALNWGKPTTGTHGS